VIAHGLRAFLGVEFALRNARTSARNAASSGVSVDWVSSRVVVTGARYL
jgi:hypothetical protein